MSLLDAAKQEVREIRSAIKDMERKLSLAEKVVDLYSDSASPKASINGSKPRRRMNYDNLPAVRRQGVSVPHDQERIFEYLDANQLRRRDGLRNHQICGGLGMFSSQVARALSHLIADGKVEVHPHDLDRKKSIRYRVVTHEEPAPKVEVKLPKRKKSLSTSKSTTNPSKGAMKPGWEVRLDRPSSAVMAKIRLALEEIDGPCTQAEVSMLASTSRTLTRRALSNLYFDGDIKLVGMRKANRVPGSTGGGRPTPEWEINKDANGQIQSKEEVMRLIAGQGVVNDNG